MSNGFVRDGEALKFFDVFKTRQCGSVADDVGNFVDSGDEFSTIDMLVPSVSRVVAAGKIYGGDAEFGSDERDVAERTLSDFEAFAGNVNLKVRIITTVENSVIGTATVKLDDKLERIDFFGQLLLLVSEAESFCPDSANFLISGKQEPWFNLRGLEDFDKSENAATVVAANALRTHEDIAVSGNANVVNGFFVHRVEMCDEHDGSLPVDENEIAFAY